MTGTLKFSSKDTSNKEISENLGKITADDLYAADSTTRITFATELQTFVQGINELTTNTYTDATVEIKTTISEIIEGGE